MAWQADHLRDMGRRPNVTIQVIPFEAGAHPGMPGSFIHLDFPDPLDPELVYIETLAGELFLESDDDSGCTGRCSTTCAPWRSARPRLAACSPTSPPA